MSTVKEGYRRNLDELWILDRKTPYLLQVRRGYYGIRFHTSMHKWIRVEKICKPYQLPVGQALDANKSLRAVTALSALDMDF
jgi:hypothetical protein